jgi:glutamate N-acetyltransferase / amino-acid N-acetyltransferase
MEKEQYKPHGIVDVPGFEAAGVRCGIRGNSHKQLDLALVFSPLPCTGAGVFTKNAIKAAPVKLGQSQLVEGSVFHGIIANSGNANACTGSQGMRDAIAMQELMAKACGITPKSIFVCSTGRIGRLLPMQKIVKGIEVLARSKASSVEQANNAARAILTSDTRSKQVSERFSYKNQIITVSGIAKGAGMIDPNMATMLAFLVTDAQIGQHLLQECLERAVANSFNAITVDGDMSTNDTVLMLANGVSNIEICKEDSFLLEAFYGMVNRVCMKLAEKIVSDGECITKVVEIIVLGADSERNAERVARSIGNSLLVKASWNGNDPNWGRLMAAIGSTGGLIVEEKIDLSYQSYPFVEDVASVPVLEKGIPMMDNLYKWKAIVSKERFSVVLNLNLGKEKFRLLSTDLSQEYVNFNRKE